MSKSVRKALLVIFATLLTLTSFSAFAQGPNEKPVGVPYTMNEIHAFWDAHIHHVIMQQLFAGIYPLDEIQSHFSEMNFAITEMYGKALLINPSQFYEKDSRYVLAGGEITASGQPVLRVFMPALMDKYRKYKSTADGRRMFEGFTVAMFIHESEHLLQRIPPVPLQTREWLITNESDAWAKTCMDVFAVFVKYKYPLDITGQHYWDDWIACGKQNNECWKKSVRQAYSDLSDHRFGK